MPADSFAWSPSTNERIWWIGWTQWWPSGASHRFARRTSLAGMLKFCKRHALTPPALPDRKR